MSTPVGLCASCQQSRQIRSDRGATFWLCRKSEQDPRFPKYPALPVLQCLGYERNSDNA
jgi:hypothetical protein